MVTAELRREIGAKESFRTVQSVRRQRVVSSPRSSRRSIVILVGILLLTLAGNTLLQAFVAKAHYQLNQKDKKIAAIDNEINRMYIELADLSSERRIASLARERLGMNYAKPGEIAFLPGDGERIDGRAYDDAVITDMLIASDRSNRRMKLSERFMGWLHGFGQAMASTEPANF